MIKCDKVVIEVVKDLEQNEAIITNKYKELNIMTMAGITPYRFRDSADKYARFGKVFTSGYDCQEKDLQYIRYDCGSTVFVFIDENAFNLTCCFANITVSTLDLSLVLPKLKKVYKYDGMLANVICDTVIITGFHSIRATQCTKLFENAKIHNLVGLDSIKLDIIENAAEMFKDSVIDSPIDFNDIHHINSCTSMSGMFQSAKLKSVSLNATIYNCNCFALFANAEIDNLNVKDLQILDAKPMYTTDVSITKLQFGKIPYGITKADSSCSFMFSSANIKNDLILNKFNPSKEWFITGLFMGCKTKKLVLPAFKPAPDQLTDCFKACEIESVIFPYLIMPEPNDAKKNYYRSAFYNITTYDEDKCFAHIGTLSTKYRSNLLMEICKICDIEYKVLSKFKQKISDNPFKPNKCESYHPAPPCFNKRSFK